LIDKRTVVRITVMRKTHLWQEAAEVDSYTTVSVTIEHPNQTRDRLWYRMSSEYSSLITQSCDPFVVATIFLAMQQRTDVVVHGEVSPSLLQNLAEFQAAWTCWCPKRYRQVEITADVEREQLKADSNKAIAAFSGGVDSCFTVFRHSTKRCGRIGRNLQAGLMVQGFDIPLEQQETFDRAAEKSRAMLASLGMELIPIATNFRELEQDWEDAHGTGIASCLMLFQRGFEAGIIASSDPYDALNLPYGSNPVSDWLLSSQSFQIVHDGASFNRIEKIREIANWPEVPANLRVCWEGSQKDRNCGRCEKCIRNILAFRVLGLGLPPCFEQDVTDSQILGIKNLKKSQLIELDPILAAARSAGISDSWVTALDRCISRERRIATLKEFNDALKKRLSPTQRKLLGKLRRRLSLP
jgi:hypothetical protein